MDLHNGRTGRGGFAARLAAFAICAALSGAAQGTLVQAWSSYVGGGQDGSDTVNAIAPGTNGEVYVGGVIADGERGNRDGLVIRVSAAGQLDWTAYVGDTGDDSVLGLALGNGQLIAVGRCPGTTSNPSASFGMIVSLDPETGTENWSDLVIGNYTGTNQLAAVAAAPDNGFYTVGYTSAKNKSVGVADYQGLDGVSYGTAFKGALDAVAMKYSSTGKLLWWRYIGGTNDDEATACAVGTDGALYVGGVTHSPGWATIGGGTPALEKASGFVTKLGADGSHAWTLFFCAETNDVTVTSLAVDAANGALYVGGTSGTFSFTPSSGQYNRNAFSGGTDGFIAKLADGGATATLLWRRFVGGSGDDAVNSVALQPNGVLAGGAAANACLGATGSDGSAFGGNTDGFIAFIPSNGTDPTWFAYQGGIGSDRTMAAAYSGAGELLAGGITHSSGWVSGGFKTDWVKSSTDTFGFVEKWAPPIPPSLTQNLADITAMDGETAFFSLAATGSSPLSYFWYWNDLLYATTSSGSLSLAADMSKDGGSLFCVVSNLVGTVKSSTATLTVTNIPPAITANPTDITVMEGETAAFSVSATGSAPLYYHWTRDGAAVEDATNATYSITSLLVDNGATFSCTVSNLSGAVTSAAALLTVTNKPTPVITSPAVRAIVGTNVTVTVVPPTGSIIWGLTETLPEGVTPTVLPASGSWDASTRQLTFAGTGAADTTLAYTVSIPSKGVYTVSGTFTVYFPASAPQTVGGDTQFVLADAIRKIDGTTVTITVTPPSGSSIFVWAAEETLAAGLTPSGLTGPNASWDASTRKITWTVLGNTPATLAYTVTGQPGIYGVSGRVTYGGDYETIYGDYKVTIPETPEPAVIPTPDILALAPAGTGTGAWTLSFVSTQNVSYAVETNASLSASAWATAATAQGANGSTSVTVPSASASLFFRVKAQQ